jgi:hypothetical protein
MPTAAGRIPATPVPARASVVVADAGAKAAGAAPVGARHRPGLMEPRAIETTKRSLTPLERNLFAPAKVRLVRHRTVPVIHAVVKAARLATGATMDAGPLRAAMVRAAVTRTEIGDRIARRRITRLNPSPRLVRASGSSRHRRTRSRTSSTRT